MTTQQRDETKRLDEALERLPLSVDPAQDLWPVIEARLQEVAGASAYRAAAST